MQRGTARRGGRDGTPRSRSHAGRSNGERRERWMRGGLRDSHTAELVALDSRERGERLGAANAPLRLGHARGARRRGALPARAGVDAFLITVARPSVVSPPP
ncbi:hypothetical protein WMF28_36545 [Sorangium sp. So ce590]|uniref:hypothetical protein n=1 Tax=Sorangium sp. So ce590 TaxID=3133317 RepID=UPI003F639EE7